MKRVFHIIFLAMLLFSSCVKENLPVIEAGGIIRDGWLTIGFGNENFNKIDISTRSTVPTAAEDAVVNVYVLMFNADGERIYGSFFDFTNRKTSVDELGDAEGWYVDNQDSGKSSGTTVYQTTGVIKIKAPTSILDNAGGQKPEIYLLANVDPAIFNLSAEKLNLVDTKEELMSMTMNFNQESTSRTGNLLMIGSANINISANNVVSLSPSSIPLERIDAKISVNVQIEPGAKTIKYELDEYGNKIEEADTLRVEAIQRIESFTPKSWRVVNLPKNSWLVSQASESEKEFFNSSTHHFEAKQSHTATVEGKAINYDVHSFSFYMLENKQTATSTPPGGWTYNARDLRNKYEDGEEKGTYTQNGNPWKYAPEYATYMVIEGEVTMQVDEKSQAPQTLNAIVRYYIHLGDFGNKDGKRDYDDFTIERNHHYTYNITVKGANNIEVEVEKDNSKSEWKPENEGQSGATGEVFIAQETIHTFDAHYGQRVFRFNFDAMLNTLGIKVKDGVIDPSYTGLKSEIADDLTWYVSTPFGREGTPDRVGDKIEIPNGLDYKWVHFLKNKINEETVIENGVTKTIKKYDQKNQWYPGEQYEEITIPETADVPNNPGAKGETLMNVNQLCEYLRDQIAKYAMGYDNDFDSERNIYMTAFVDEFYYEEDPISGNESADLWNDFVNKPMRMMHILCSALTSRDGESSATGSVVTIRQRAIETIYEGCLEGWGSESVDETVNSDPQKSSNKHLWFFNSGETDASWGSYSLEDGVMNYSKFNGLYNTGHLWDILDGGNMSLTTNSSYTTRNVQWNSYLDFVRKNDYSYQGNDDNVRINFLREDPEIMTMRYTCMMRNRDNNGNGIIDAEEVRWYLASTEQLMALYLGDLGLNNIAKLYYTEDDDNVEKGVSGDMYYPWRIHVVSSTRSPENLSKPEMIWAEEGCSTSAYGSDWGKSGLLSIRCVRNLGHDQDVPGDLPYDIENPNSYPQSPVLMKASDNNHDANTIYRFNMESLNSASRRIRVSTELITLDENSEMARVYKGFETGPLGREGSSFGSVTDFPAMKNDLIDGYSQCPEGYRMPNIREATIMYNYIPSTSAFWGERLYFVNNYYSFGSPTVGGNGYDGDTYTWSFSSNRIMLSGSGMFIRCVRDIEPEDYSWD